MTTRGPTDDEDILEIIDQRRPPASPVKYVALAVVAVVAVVCVYLFIRHFTPREISQAVVTPMERSAELTGKFLQHAANFLTTSNVSTRTEVEVGLVTALDKNGPLVVAKQDILLRYTNVDEAIFGTSKAEVRANAQAFYYVPLLGSQAEWQIETIEKDGVRVCIVHAPALRVLTPLNIDSRNVEITATAGVLRTNRQEMLQAALADLTPRLNREALNQAVHARTAARRTVATFVRTWLQQDKAWGPGRINALQVLFPDETGVEAEFTIPGFYDKR